MKRIFVLTCMLISAVAVAQSNEDSENENEEKKSDIGVVSATTYNLETIASQGIGSQVMAGITTFYNPKFDKIGTYYLFDDWNNYARIFPKGSDVSYSANNINFNIQRSMFESRKGDSLTRYNFASIDRIVVGNRAFKSYYFEPLQRPKVFEIIYAGEDFAILKDYIVDIQEANPNPMIARNRDKIIRRANYYIETSDKLEEFKFSKRNILKALGEEKAEIAADYAKKYQMSFRDEEDLRKILNYVKRQ